MQILKTSLWARRLALYFSLGAGVIVISHVVFSYFGFLHTDVDSARYMLSALIQSEAAIVALVVTLSLVAVQLAAQSYSARVIEVFRRTPDLWILMGVYGFAMFWGLGVLKLIEKENLQANSLANLEGHIVFSYYLGVFAFAALVPYIWKTLDLLKPSTVIDMLSGKITKQNILAAIREGDEKSGENDPIQPIIDIVRGSLMKYDYETVRYGLRAIGDHTNYIFKNETFENVEEINLSEHLFAHLKRVGKLAASKDDEDSTLEVIINLQKNGETTVERNLDEATRQIVLALGLIGENTAGQKFEYVTEWAAGVLGIVGKAAAEKRLDGSASLAVTYISKVGVASAEQNLEAAATNAISSLSNIGFVVAGQKHDESTKWVAFHLGEIGKTTAKHKLNSATSFAALDLNEIGKAAVEQKLEKSSKAVAESLGMIGIVAAEQELEGEVMRVVDFLMEIGKAAVGQELKGAAHDAIISLKKIAKAASEENLNRAEFQATDSFKKIYKLATERKLKLPSDVLFSLRKSGKAMAKENLEEREQQTAESLEKLIKIAEEQAKTTQQILEYLERINETLGKIKK
jgi:F0F1-type ATP synthase assembly protein I